MVSSLDWVAMKQTNFTNPVRFRVGDGSSIHVWNDRWLPLPSSFRAAGYKRYMFPGGLVEDLIDPDTMTWHEPLLREFFLPHEVEAILSIPHGRGGKEDTVVWHHTKSGEYTVKSGHHVLCQAVETEKTGASTSHGHSRPIWRQIWKLRVLPKVRLFLWRAIFDILPTGSSFHRRIGSTSPHCLLRGTEVESLRHCLFECGWLTDLRRICSQYDRWCSSRARSFEGLVESVFAQDSAEDRCLFSTILWAIWKKRCSGVFEGKLRPAGVILGEAVNLISHQPSFLTEVAARHHVSSFVAPPPGCIAIHVDAACSCDGRTAGGVIYRIWRGEVLLAGNFLFTNGIDVEHAELLAIREGLQLALRFEGTQAILWTDSLLNVGRLNEGCAAFHRLKPLVDECLHLVAQIPDCGFQFTRREGNMPAHLIAKLELQSLLGIVGNANLPSSIVLSIAADITE